MKYKDQLKSSAENVRSDAPFLLLIINILYAVVLYFWAIGNAIESLETPHGLLSNAF